MVISREGSGRGSCGIATEGWWAGAQTGKDVIIRTDVQGAQTWRKRLEGAIFVFLLAEEREALRARLIGRGSEDSVSIERRIAELEAELDDIENNDYIVYNRHGELAEAVREIEGIIERERRNPSRPCRRTSTP